MAAKASPITSAHKRGLVEAHVSNAMFDLYTEARNSGVYEGQKRLPFGFILAMRDGGSLRKNYLEVLHETALEQPISIFGEDRVGIYRDKNRDRWAGNLVDTILLTGFAITQPTSI